MADHRPPLPGTPSAELIHACVEGSLFGVLQALRQGANPNAWRLNEGPALHSALPWPRIVEALLQAGAGPGKCGMERRTFVEDRKSTRLNSSHSQISYAVFCLKKKKN